MKYYKDAIDDMTQKETDIKNNTNRTVANFKEFVWKEILGLKFLKDALNIGRKYCTQYAKG